MYLQATCLCITFLFQIWIVTCPGMSCGQFFAPFDFACTKYTSSDNVAWDMIHVFWKEMALQISHCSIIAYCLMRNLFF